MRIAPSPYPRVLIIHDACLVAGVLLLMVVGVCFGLSRVPGPPPAPTAQSKYPPAEDLLLSPWDFGKAVEFIQHKEAGHITIVRVSDYGFAKGRCHWYRVCQDYEPYAKDVKVFTVEYKNELGFSQSITFYNGPVETQNDTKGNAFQGALNSTCTRHYQPCGGIDQLTLYRFFDGIYPKFLNTPDGQPMWRTKPKFYPIWRNSTNKPDLVRANFQDYVKH